MSYSANFKVVATLLAVLVSLSAAAKSGKIRYAVGEPENKVILHPNGKQEEAKIGGKIKEKDKVRTGLESQVIVALPDGSTISIEENSLVEFSTLNAENGIQTAMTDVKQGKVRFDAQKQTGKSSFQFKTGTATAAIRGTEGGAGITPKNRPVYALNSGLIEVNDQCGAKTSVSAGEAVIGDGKCGFRKFKLKHAGDTKVMDQLLKLGDADNLSNEEVQKQLDVISEAIDKAITEKIIKTVCTAEGVPDTVTKNSLTTNINCASEVPNTLTVNGTTFQGTSSGSYTIEWVDNALGVKRFDLICKDTVDLVGIIQAQLKEFGKQKKKNQSDIEKANFFLNLLPNNLKKAEYEFTCGSIEFMYYDPAIDSLNKARLDSLEKQDSLSKGETHDKELSVNVNVEKTCDNGAIDIEGKISGHPTQVSFVLGPTTETLNLDSSQTEFTHSISVNDQKKNWNATELVVTVTLKDGSTLVQKLPISINKACKTINTNKPAVTIVNQQTGIPIAPCKASFKISNNTDDEGIGSLFIDGDLIKEFNIQNNDAEDFALASGTHTYKIVFNDQAGNTNSAQSKLVCLDPNNTAYIAIDGIRSPSSKRLRVPPPPRDVNKYIYKNMRYEIKNIKNDDYSQIESITITQSGVNGNVFYLSNANNGIDHLTFNQNIALERNKTTTVKVRVKLYNGKILENSITYEAR
ncbi:MAG: FecR domain-containing protein [Fibrobacter sp.]|nr:FecR domain-containing protein [Fibrobacter sp.]